MKLPPQQLHAPPRLARALLTPIGAALLLLALIAQLGGTWVIFSDYYRYDPRFAQLGLISYGGLNVAGAPSIAETQAIPTGSLVTGICSSPDRCTELDAKTTYEQLSDLLDGPMDSQVRLRFLIEGRGDVQLTLARSEAHRHIAAPGWMLLIDQVVLPSLGLLAAGFGLFVSVMLWRKKDDPVAPLLAFGLIGLVLSSDATNLFWQWAIADAATATMSSSSATLFAFACLSVAMPAFPDGRYRPAWGGWVALAAASAAFCSFALSLYLFEAGKPVPEILLWLEPALTWLFAALTLASIVVAGIRFRAMPAGLEKQKVKWAALGLIAGLLAIALADVLWQNISLGGPAATGLDSAIALVSSIGRVAIPLGMLMSLMGIRLNDADRVIGRSAGYTLITLLIAAIWAASTNWINTLVENQVAPAAAAGLSAIIAAAIFVPVRERILKWTERLLQPAMVKLRSLPAKILPWREDHTPADVGRGTLLAIVNGIQATSAALVLSEEKGDEVVAAYEVTPDQVIEDLARNESEPRIFPMHVRLTDLCGPVGFLLIGPRSDGASYRSDEKDAVALVAGPLADVLRATSRRAGRERALTQMLTAVDARIARLETLRASV
jgi:hypothetical protein